MEIDGRGFAYFFFVGRKEVGGEGGGDGVGVGVGCKPLEEGRGGRRAMKPDRETD